MVGGTPIGWGNPYWLGEPLLVGGIPIGWGNPYLRLGQTAASCSSRTMNPGTYLFHSQTVNKEVLRVDQLYHYKQLG